MAKLELLIMFAFVALVYCTEVEDVEQKKRGVEKGTNLNSIPSGAQKQDYTYNIYSSIPSSQSSSNSYQTQVPNSFYPNQGNSQYYTASNTQTEAPAFTPHQQPQINALSAPQTSQFIPLNFIPNPGYQTRYHIVPSKPNGNIHLAIYQPPNNYQSPPIMSYTPQLFSPHSTNQISQQPFNLHAPSGHFNIAPNYQPLGSSYLGQPSTMLLLASPSLNQPYNNLIYPNPLQNFYNYYSSNAHSKVNVPYASQGAINEYDKLQSSITQGIPKEENDITHNGEYTSSSDASTNYKSSYAGARNTYTKL